MSSIHLFLGKHDYRGTGTHNYPKRAEHLATKKGIDHQTCSKLTPILQVEFSSADHACQRCGQEGDLRLMTDMCHLEKGCGHDKDLLTRFTKGQVLAYQHSSTRDIQKL